MELQCLDMSSGRIPMVLQIYYKGVDRFAQGRRWHRLVPFCALGRRGSRIEWLDAPPHLQVLLKDARPQAPCAATGCGSLIPCVIGDMSSSTHVYFSYMYLVEYCAVYSS